jgi:HlyD family secretion protein
MQVDTNVAEADIGRIQVGQKASFTVDAYPGEHFKGRIRQIRVSPQTVQNVVTYDVVIDVDNPELKLLPGMTANAEFVTSRREDVLKVSNAAFRFHPPADLLPSMEQRHHQHGEARAEGRTGEGKTPEVHTAGDKETGTSGRKNLWVLRDGQPKMVPVQIGITDGHETEIVSGDVQESDLIVSAVNAETSKGQGGMRRLF